MTTMTSAASTVRQSTTQRMLWIDNLRIVIVLSLVLFHTARLFDHETWHIKNAGTYVAADVLVATFNFIGMPTLFLLAGFGAVLSLRRRSISDFLIERFLRLIVPLFFGIFLFVLPQVLAERRAPVFPTTMSPARSEDSLFAFFGDFFQCCYPQANFSYHHLWFLLYLFVYSLVLLPVFRVLARRQFESFAKTSEGAAVLLIIFTMALPVAMSEVLLRRTFPSTHALIDDWANHVHYLCLIGFGGVLAATPAALAALRRYASAIAAVAAALLLLSLANAFLLHSVGGVMWLVARTITEICIVTAALGAFVRWGDRTIPFITSFAPFGQAFYIIHQTVIVVLGAVLVGWTTAPLIKFTLIAMASALASAFLARLSAIGWLSRLIFGTARTDGTGRSRDLRLAAPDHAAKT